MRTRTIALRREALTELDPAELAAVAGAGPESTTCPITYKCVVVEIGSNVCLSNGQC